MKRALIAALCLVTGTAAAAATPTPPAARAYGDVLIKGVPHVLQKPDFCGEACVAMFLGKLGHKGDQDWAFNESGVDPLEGRGARTREMAAALATIGFKAGPVWHQVAAARAAKELENLWREAHADLERGVPSLVCMRTGERPGATEHFRLLLGYEAAGDEIIYHEPAESGGAYRRMKRSAFLSLWPLKYEESRWTVIRARLEPGTLKPWAPAAGLTSAAYAQHIRELKPKVPRGFTILIERPFVVIGDDRPELVRRCAEGTVRWAVEHLRRLYFPKDPAEILDIWLFKGDESYRANTKMIFGDSPSTPFGYFSREHGALIMNIATGGGTLVHEIVHPLMAANFPGCPDWFNEGLASLYEQSSERDGRIVGLTNWRLAGLKEAIERKKLPPFKDLLATRNHSFYACDPGSNYAQARYLCYYLQEQKLLVKFFHAFRDDRMKDPTGLETLKRILGERQGKDMDAFQAAWEKWGLALRFP